MPRPKKEQPNHAGGLYEVKITVGKTIDGKLIRKSFYSSTSKADARAQAEQYKIDREVASQTGAGFISKDITFADWARKWLETYKKPDVDDNTYRLTYQNTVDKHLIPYFGKAALVDVRPIDVKNFYASKKSMSKSMLSKMRLCLNGMYDAAINNDLCYKNPAKGITFVSDKAKNKKDVYTDDQIKAVEAYAADKLPEVIVLLETGLRRGELLGLKWEDIDLKNGILNVSRSVADKKGGGVSINPPKWGSYRTIPLSAAAKRAFIALPKDTEYVFPLENSAPQSPNSWARKLDRFMVKVHAEKPDVPILTAHELRHTYGTSLRRRGVDIYTIQKVMGHKDIKMTSEIYVHNEIEELKKAVKMPSGKRRFKITKRIKGGSTTAG